MTAKQIQKKEQKQKNSSTYNVFCIKQGPARQFTAKQYKKNRKTVDPQALI